MALNYKQACKVLGIDTNASENEIKKAYRKKLIRWEISKWKQRAAEKGYGCNDGKCGEVPHRGGSQRFFHSPKCKEIYDLTERNYNLIKEAYQVLTGGKGQPNNGNNNHQPEPNRDNNLANCDFCRREYDFVNANYGRKDFRKKDGENEPFDFCSKSCYDNFYFCYVCENKRTKDNLGKWKKKRGHNIFFCSDACQKNFKQGGSSGQNDPFEEQDSKCDQCGGDFQKNEKGVKIMWHIGNDKSRWYCSEKCAKDYLNQQNQPEQGEEENASENPLTNPIISRGGGWN